MSDVRDFPNLKYEKKLEECCNELGKWLQEKMEDVDALTLVGILETYKYILINTQVIEYEPREVH